MEGVGHGRLRAVVVTARLGTAARWVLPAAAIVLMLAGCGTSDGHSIGPQAMATMMRGRATQQPGEGSASMPMRAGTEASYLSVMVAHQDGAIRVARELFRSDPRPMRRFGRRIVTVQSAQVRLMISWLRRWYPDAAPTRYRPLMGDLSGLVNPALDRVLIQRMIAHQTMAVMMSRMLLVSGRVQHAVVARLARTIIAQQTAEIRLMRRWLSHPGP